MCDALCKLCCGGKDDRKRIESPHDGCCGCTCDDPTGCCGCGCEAGAERAWCRVGGRSDDCCGEKADECCGCCCGFGYFLYLPLTAIILGAIFGLPVAILVVVIPCETDALMKIWAYVMCGWYLVELLVQLRMSNLSDEQKLKTKEYGERAAANNRGPQAGTRGDKYYPAAEKHLILPVDSAVLHRDLVTGEALDLAECVNALYFFIVPVLKTAMLVLGHMGLGNADLTTCAADEASTVRQATPNATSASESAAAAVDGSRSDAFHGVVIATLVWGWLTMFIHLCVVMPSLLEVDAESNLNEFGRSRARRRIREADILRGGPNLSATAEASRSDLETPSPQPQQSVSSPDPRTMQRTVEGERSSNGSAGSVSPAAVPVVVPVAVPVEKNTAIAQQEALGRGEKNQDESASASAAS